MTAAPGWRHRGRQRLRRARHSLGARLVGLFLLFALAVTISFVAGMQGLLRGSWQDYARPLVADYTDKLVAEIGSPPDLARAQALAERLPLRIRIDGPSVNWRSDGGDLRLDTRHRLHDAAEPNANGWRPVRTTADGHRISFRLADVVHEDRPRLIGWATLALLLVLTALAYAAVRHLLHPLQDIGAGAVRYGQGDFSRPIAARRDDELGQLAGQINTMAAQLRGMLDAKRQLLLAISHELRSPLTRARLNAELVGEGTARDALLRDLAEMRDLIDDLLESERLAAGHAALQREPVDLNALVREVISAGPPDRSVSTLLDAGLPPLDADPARLRLLVRNLLDNARRHGGGAAPPTVTTRRDGETLQLAVRDHGPGVDEAQLARLGEAFYRPDDARQRSTGGVGLGLTLCRLIAQAHGGQLLLRNASPGLEATLTLPLAAPQAGP